MSAVPPPPGPPTPPEPPISPPPPPPPYVPPPTTSVSAPGPVVPNHMIWAIISMVFSLCLCCGIPGLITGIVAIVFSAKVNGLLAAGDFDGAWRASRTAKIWCIVTTVLAAIGILNLIYTFTLGGGIAQYQSVIEQVRMQSGQ